MLLLVIIRQNRIIKADPDYLDSFWLLLSNLMASQRVNASTYGVELEFDYGLPFVVTA